MKKKKIIVILAIITLTILALAVHFFGVVGYRCISIHNVHKHEHNTYGFLCHVPNNVSVEAGLDYDG